MTSGHANVTMETAASHLGNDDVVAAGGGAIRSQSRPCAVGVQTASHPFRFWIPVSQETGNALAQTAILITCRLIVVFCLEDTGFCAICYLSLVTYMA